MTTQALQQVKEAMKDLVDVIEAAGLLNLTKGVQLGQTAWYVKASDALTFAKKTLATVSDAPPSAQEPEGWRAALLLALYHHQGGSSPVGQPIRKLLGIGQYAPLTDAQIAQAKSVSTAPAAPAVPGADESCANCGLSHSTKDCIYAAAPAAQAARSVPDGWKLTEKANCFQLAHGNEVVALLSGPSAEANAAKIASMLAAAPSAPTVLEDMPAPLTLAGQRMANTMYNMAQRIGHALTAADADNLRRLQKAWDEAYAVRNRAAAPSAPSTPLPPIFSQEHSDAMYRAGMILAGKMPQPAAPSVSADSKASERDKTIREAVVYHDGQWPQELYSGVMFFKGERITENQFKNAIAAQSKGPSND